MGNKQERPATGQIDPAAEQTDPAEPARSTAPAAQAGSAEPKLAAQAASVTSTMPRQQMARVNRIVSHPLWRAQLHRIAELERERIFCGHDLDHFLHVARLAYIETLEKGLSISREIIYAAALLHDIGRAVEYEKGIPHHEAGRTLAEEILQGSGFSEEEQMEILKAISSHRDVEARESEELAGVIYRADKQSRNCFCCGASDLCNWPDHKKNKEIRG